MDSKAEMTKPVWLSNTDLAKRLGVKPLSINRWRKAYDCPPGVKMGVKVLNRVDEWDLWMEKHRKSQQLKQQASTEEARPPKKKARS